MSQMALVDLQLAVQDTEADDETLQQMLRQMAIELESRSATVDLVSPEAQTFSSDAVSKGGKGGGSILDVKINLDTLKQFGGWLYDRIVGTTTETNFEIDGAKFSWKGRDLNDRAAAIADFERFVEATVWAKRNGNG